MAAAAPVPSLEAGDPSPGKVSFKETTEMIEATWGPGGTKPNDTLYMAATMQAVQRYQDGKEERSFKNTPSPFVRQAGAFLAALDSRTLVHNPPVDAMLDIGIAAALSRSVRSGRSIALDEVFGAL